MNRKLPFVLVALVCRSVFAAPCTTSPPVFFLNLSVQPAPNNPASLRLHYENSYLGYAPQYGTLSVSIAGGGITVVQPVADIETPDRPDSPTPSVLCDAQDIDLGPLGSGVYSIVVVHPVTVAGVGRGAFNAGVGGFLIGANGAVQCTSMRSFSVLTPPVPRLPVTVASTILTRGFYSGTRLLSRNGDVFYVVDDVSTELPAEYVPYCLTSTVDIGVLPAGKYSVRWSLNDFGVVRPDGVGLFPFTIAAPAKRRASAR